MLVRQKVKYTPNYKLPSTKLRNVFCLQCKHQFFFQEFVPLRGIVPLLLDCGHVICDKCAKSFANKPCPTCNIISQSEDHTSSLPLNIYALGLMIVSHNRSINTDDSHISFAKSVNSKVKEKRIKDLCYECGIQATIKCPECSALYCFTCYSKIHGRALQNHSKIVLSEDNNENSFTVQNTCSERCNEPLGYYCENCNIAGCSHCMLRSHKKHNYQPLIQKNQELMNDFYSTFNQVSQNLQRVRQVQKKLTKTSMHSTDTQTDGIEASVTEHFTYLHGVLQNLERTILDSLQEHRSSRMKNIEDISAQLKEHEFQLQSALVVITSISENLDKINLRQVMHKLQKMVDIPCHLILNSAPDDEEITFNIDHSIVETIEKHCSIYIPETSTFSLQPTSLLPDDYEIEPLIEENIPKSNNTFREMNSPPTSVSLPSRRTDSFLSIVTCTLRGYLN